MELRDYQTRAIDLVSSEWRAGALGVILAAPCGSGKTVIAAEMIRRALANGKRVGFFCDTVELVEQTSKTLEALGIGYATSDGHGILKSGYEKIPELAVQVASVQTWWSWYERGSANPPVFDLVILDECHAGVTAKTYGAVREAAPWLVGLTATPALANGRALGRPWDRIIEVARYSELIRRGHLVGTECWVPAVPDLCGCPKDSRTGDFVMGQRVVGLMQKHEIVGSWIESYHRHCRGLPTLFGACTVEHSLFARDRFRAEGLRAEHVDARTPADERAEVMAQALAGRVDVLCGFRVIGRGLDLPNFSAIINCRPFGSLVPYRQFMGRVLRPWPGKTIAKVIDHTGSVLRFGFPDEDFPWPQPNAKERATTRLLHEFLRTERRQFLCPACKAYWETGPECPQCGWRARTRASNVTSVKGSLAYLARKQRKRQAANYSEQQAWKRIVGMCANTGKLVCQASAIFHRRMGHWPGPELLPRFRFDQARMKVATLVPQLCRRPAPAAMKTIME